jgi:hypothetical protein
MTYKPAYLGASIELTINGPEFLKAFGDAVFAAIKDEFEGPILETAKAMSPIDEGDKREGTPGHLIHNRDSLRARAFFTEDGPMGKLYSTSGHGYFIEVGTRFTGARPYAWPAVQSHIGELMARIKTNISVIQMGDGSAAFELGRVNPDTSNEDISSG